MAHLWQLDDATDGGWTPTPLDANTTLAAAARFETAHTVDGDAWVVLGDATVRVNGFPLDAGIAVLRERDELLAGGERVFFSTEKLATITTYAGGERPVFCPRCKLEITAGTPVVRCPACGVLHHQSDDYSCWLYAEHCTTCDQPTALDAGFRWSPEVL
jgi:uncharacterized C2H2 Zn-finger protein